MTAPVSGMAARPAQGDELADGQRCPACASQRLHRSLARSRWERIRKLFTHQRLFRCHHCAWRGWADVMELAGIQEFPTTTEQDFALPELPRDPAASPDEDPGIRVTDKVMN